MQFAYLVAAIIFLAVWSVLFIRRVDLRREMLTMSLIAAPICLFDVIAVPLWWSPVTLFNIPIGIEGVIYSFCIGGIAAVLYAEVARKKLRHLHAYHKSAALIVLATTAIIFLPLALLKVASPVIILYIALLAGLGVALYFRKDLVRGSVIGAFSFGLLYFVLIKVWFALYPAAAGWFLFQGLPPAHLLGVPVWELLFGMIFAAYWGNIYEVLFGYRFVTASKRNSRK